MLATECISTDHALHGCSQVSTRPQSAQRLAQATMATGGSMAGEELLPPTALEHEMCVMLVSCVQMTGPEALLALLRVRICAARRILDQAAPPI